MREKDMIAVRTDIKLPHLIREALDEQGIRQGEHDRRIQIDGGLLKGTFKRLKRMI
jgi:hypothetical protein